MDDEILRVMKFVDLAVQIPKYTYEMQRNASKPTGPFAAVKMVEEVNPGRDANEIVTLPDGQIVNRTKGVRLVTYQVLFAEGLPMVNKFLSCFMRPDIQDYMVSADLSILRHKKATNQSLALETNWEIRESVYIECMVRRTVDSEITTIESVEATGVYNEGSDQRVDLQINTTRKES